MTLPFSLCLGPSLMRFGQEGGWKGTPVRTHPLSLCLNGPEPDSLTRTLKVKEPLFCFSCFAKRHLAQNVTPLSRLCKSAVLLICASEKCIQDQGYRSQPPGGKWTSL